MLHAIFAILGILIFIGIVFAILESFLEGIANIIDKISFNIKQAAKVKEAKQQKEKVEAKYEYQWIVWYDPDDKWVMTNFYKRKQDMINTLIKSYGIDLKRGYERYDKGKREIKEP